MKRLIACAAFAATLGTSAAATTITVSAFSSADYAALTSGPATTIEDFESTSTDAGFVGFADAGATSGELSGVLSTDVGTFQTVGGTGGAGTCSENSLSGSCNQIALTDGDNGFDQGNLVPDNGTWALNNNDTLGIVWNVALAAGGMFDRVVFALRDIADRDGIKVTISADGATPEVVGPGLLSDNKNIVVVDFGGAGVSSATITVQNNNANPADSFSLDGAAVQAVPLPASALLLLGGLGLLGAARRRAA